MASLRIEGRRHVGGAAPHIEPFYPELRAYGQSANFSSASPDNSASASENDYTRTSRTAQLRNAIWEEFTTLYTQGIERAVRHSFPGLELDVEPSVPRRPGRLDGVQLPLRGTMRLSHALRKMERRPQPG